MSTAYAASGIAATATGAVTAGSRYCATSFARATTAFSTARAQASRSTASVGGLEGLELGERRPLRVDRQPAPVGQQQPELHDPAADAEVGGEHGRRQRREVIAQDVLAGTTLRRAAGEHRGEPADHLALLAVAAAALLLADAELLERPPGAVQALSQLLAAEVALGGRSASRRSSAACTSSCWRSTAAEPSPTGRRQATAAMPASRPNAAATRPIRRSRRRSSVTSGEVVGAIVATATDTTVGATSG